MKQFDLESAAEAIVEGQQVRREPRRNVMNAAPPQSIPDPLIEPTWTTNSLMCLRRLKLGHA